MNTNQQQLETKLPEKQDFDDSRKEQLQKNQLALNWLKEKLAQESLCKLEDLQDAKEEFELLTQIIDENRHRPLFNF